MKFFGKYRGTVINNVDPMQIGRIQAQVPDVLGLVPSSWAMPCMPFTGKQMGMWKGKGGRAPLSTKGDPKAADGMSECEHGDDF